MSFIRFESDTPELAPAWIVVGAALCRDPNVPPPTNRDIKPLLQEHRTMSALGIAGRINASGLAPGIFTDLKFLKYLPMFIL